MVLGLAISEIQLATITNLEPESQTKQTTDLRVEIHGLLSESSNHCCLTKITEKQKVAKKESENTHRDQHMTSGRCNFRNPWWGLGHHEKPWQGTWFMTVADGGAWRFSHLLEENIPQPSINSCFWFFKLPGDYMLPIPPFFSETRKLHGQYSWPLLSRSNSSLNGLPWRWNPTWWPQLVVHMYIYL